MATKIVAIVLGLGLGVVGAELAIGQYYERWMWLSFHRPPAYAEDDRNVRFALLGGSTSAGAPYSSLQSVEFNLLSPLQLLLAERYGYENVEIDSYAWHGWTAEQTVAAYWEGAEYKPDVLVIYTGQNEGNHYDGWTLVPHPDTAWELWAAESNIGDLLLRSWFRWQRSASAGVLGATRAWASDGDIPQYQPFQPFSLSFPSWSLFDAHVVPPYERAYNARHFERLVTAVVRHAKREGILPIVIVPEGNHLYPPATSYFEGATKRRGEAIQTFKRGLYWKHFGGDREEARRLLDEIATYSGFARLHFELGEMLYEAGDTAAAREHLLRAMESDAQPLIISRRHRTALQRIAQVEGVPAIDMRDLVTNDAHPIPDFHAFHDAVHPTLAIYEDLSRAILNVLREASFDKLALPEIALPIYPSERAERQGLTQEAIHHSMAAQARWYEVTAESAFFKLRPLDRAIRYMDGIAGAQDAPADLVAKAKERGALLRRLRREARKHFLVWLQAGET